MESNRSWQAEFSYYPSDAMPQLSEQWKDISHKDDVCPCFEHSSGTILFCDHPEPEMREFEEGKRFTLQATHSGDTICSAEDWAEMSSALVRLGLLCAHSADSLHRFEKRDDDPVKLVGATSPGHPKTLLAP